MQGGSEGTPANTSALINGLWDLFRQPPSNVASLASPTSCPEPSTCVAILSSGAILSLARIGSTNSWLLAPQPGAKGQSTYTGYAVQVLKTRRLGGGQSSGSRPAIKGRRHGMLFLILFAFLSSTSSSVCHTSAVSLSPHRSSCLTLLPPRGQNPAHRSCLTGLE